MIDVLMKDFSKFAQTKRKDEELKKVKMAKLCKMNVKIGETSLTVQNGDTPSVND